MTAPHAAVPPPIRYRVDLAAAAQHLLAIEALFPAETPQLELAMAVWTPGSYLVREFSRHVEGVAARDAGGRALPVEKTAKNRWRIATGGAAEVIVSWRVYARELSVRTPFADASFALLNGAGMYLTLADARPRPHRVELALPAGWEAHTTLAPADDGGAPLANAWLAADYDALVDAPIYAGRPTVHRFEVSGREHALLNEGETDAWDGAKAAADLERIVAVEHAFWGTVPYDRYLFVNLIAEGYGGLEHRDSCVLLTGRFKPRSRKGWLEWLSLAAHELFHAWNVKRLRPHALGPFDYEREVYTPDLWIAEGITSYYDDLLVHRAGLSTREEYLAALSENVLRVQTTPGRAVQSLAQSSLDTWIKLYRPDENSINTALSYYVKGAVVAFLLDQRIRRSTAGDRSLDDVMRLAYARHSGDAGFAPAEFGAAAEEVAGSDLGDFLAAAVEGTGELDYGEALAELGLRFAASKPAPDPAAPPRGWMGATLRLEDARVSVGEVRRDGPAYAAGLNVGDEVIAVGDLRVPPRGFDERLSLYRPGETLSLLVARRERLQRIEVTLAPEPQPRWKLEVDPDAPAGARARLQQWLGTPG